MKHEITELNKEQQKAFNRLKRAYRDCVKEGVIFANRYGHLHAYDKNLVCSFGDGTIHAPKSVSEVEITEVNGGNYLEIPNEWSDDDGSHYLGLTEKGNDLYFKI